MLLIDSYPSYLAGDPDGNVHGPGQGRPYHEARALSDLIAQCRLCGTWVTTHGREFGATWSRGRSSNKIEKFLFPPELSCFLTSCEVLNFPTNAPRISDHALLSVKLFSDEVGQAPICGE